MHDLIESTVIVIDNLIFFFEGEAEYAHGCSK